MNDPAAICIRDATPVDAAAVAGIYNTHVCNTTVTFEMQAIDTAQMAQRIADVQAPGLPWLVMCDGDAIIGYACVGTWKSRTAYAHTVESSIYLHEHAHGRGLGKLLYAALIERLRASHVHVVIGGVTQPNPASDALHQAMGFTFVGTFREVGFKFGQWIDVGYWQRVLVD